MNLHSLLLQEIIYARAIKNYIRVQLFSFLLYMFANWCCESVRLRADGVETENSKCNNTLGRDCGDVKLMSHESADISLGLLVICLKFDRQGRPHFDTDTI